MPKNTVREWNARRSCAEERVDDEIARLYEPGKRSAAAAGGDEKGAKLKQLSLEYTALPPDLFDEVVQSWLFLRSFGHSAAAQSAGAGGASANSSSVEGALGLSSALPRLEDLEAALLAPLESGSENDPQALRNKMLLDEIHIALTRVIGENAGAAMFHPGYEMFGRERPLNPFTWPELLRQQLVIATRAKEFPQFELSRWKDVVSVGSVGSVGPAASVAWVTRDATERPLPGEFLLFTVTFYANLAHNLTRSP